MSILTETLLPFALLAGLFAAGTVAIIFIRRRIFRAEQHDTLTSFIELRNSGAITADEWEKIKASASRQS